MENIMLFEAFSNKKEYGFLSKKILNKIKKILNSDMYVMNRVQNYKTHISYKISIPLNTKKYNNIFGTTFLYGNKKVLYTKDTTDILSYYKDISKNEEKYNKQLVKYLSSIQEKLIQRNILFSFTVKVLPMDSHHSKAFNIDLHFKDMYFKRVNPPKYVYHELHDRDKVDKILEQGIKLKPHSESNMWKERSNLYYPPAIFVKPYDSRFYGSGYLFKIDTTNLKNKWYVDPNMHTYISEEARSLITYDYDIPPSALTIYEP